MEAPQQRKRRLSPNCSPLPLLQPSRLPLSSLDNPFKDPYSKVKSIAFLPAEVLLQIFRLAAHPPLSIYNTIDDFTSSSESDHRRDYKPAALPLVCRAWYPIASDVLFEHIYITHASQLKCLASQLQPRHPINPTAEPVKKRPPYNPGRWTKSLDVAIELAPAADGTSPNSHLPDLVEVVRRLPRLISFTYHPDPPCAISAWQPNSEWWELAGTHQGVIDALIKVCGASLRCLNWYGGLRIQDELKKLLLGCTKLEVVTVQTLEEEPGDSSGGTVEEDGEPTGHPECWPPLSTFSIPTMFLTTAPIRLPSLRCLQPRGFYPDTLEILLSSKFLAVHADELTSISLVYVGSAASVPTMMRVAMQCHRLIDISFQLTNNEPPDDNPPPFQRDLHHPTLKRIGIFGPLSTYRSPHATAADCFFISLSRAFTTLLPRYSDLPSLDTVRVLNREEELQPLMDCAQRESAMLIRRRASEGCVDARDEVGRDDLKGTEMRVAGGLRPDWWSFWKTRFMTRGSSERDSDLGALGADQRRHSMPMDVASITLHSRELNVATTVLPTESRPEPVPSYHPVRLEDHRGELIEPIWHP